MSQPSTPLQDAGSQLAHHIIRFGRVLRRAGLEVATSQIMDAFRALQTIGVRRRDDVYQAFFSIFVTRKEQLEIFDQAFHLFWKAPSRLPQMMELLLPSIEVPQQAKSKAALRVKQALVENEPKPRKIPRKRQNKNQEGTDLVFTYSATEILRHKDFAEFTAEEVLQAKKLMAKMQWPIEAYPTRRLTRDDRGRLLDLRRTIRRSLQHHGEIVHLKWHGRDLKIRPVVILCDISGSMERYSRLLLHFMHAITEGLKRVETFVFGTRLTRITRYLNQRDIDDAIASVSNIVNDWAGGTKIGEALKDFNYLWARRVLRNGAVVMIISDGWDRGNIPLLEREMDRLSRSCYRLIWLNPLLGFEGYEPLTKGMKAAMPFIDHFLPVHNLESLDQLGKILSTMIR